MIGRDTQSYIDGAPQFNTPNHHYDTQRLRPAGHGDLATAKLPASALPAVSFLKAPGYQDGHAGYSDPAEEQQFVTSTVNALEKTADWRNTVVIVNWDDSDGWYDHVYSGVTNPSLSPADNLTDTKSTLPTSGQCGPKLQAKAPLGGRAGALRFRTADPIPGDLAVRQAQPRRPRR